MNEDLIINNILVFLDRVAVTGRKEVSVYAECCNWLEGKRPKEKKIDADKK